MATFDRVFAVVEGVGEVPFDMLRYDCCFPDSSDDASRMYSVGEPSRRRAFILCRFTGQMGSFAPARWNSFLWGCQVFTSHSAAVEWCKLRNTENDAAYEAKMRVRAAAQGEAS